MRRSLVIAVMSVMPMVALANQNSRPDIQVNVPPEVFSTHGQSSPALHSVLRLPGSELLRRRGNKSGRGSAPVPA